MHELNSLSFILQGGAVSIAVALILLAMSMASWYFIVVKAVLAVRTKAALNRYVKHFWATPNLLLALKIEEAHSPALQLSHSAVAASKHHQAHTTLASACSEEEFVARSMRRSIANTGASLESGLSLLASVGSIAPFVGLFGTVWGIYHALAAISASGQASLDKVAGPVGEALIMTAIGLAVAIPAVLAYNAFVKTNRNLIQTLDAFAQDLHVLLTTGATLHHQSGMRTKHEVAHINAVQNKVAGVAA